ncbi:hypothetical protein HDU85_000643 [Gaertneriomyces sp. JEL0708]|nr:hypothetical protein HDU85_000643 [Gaertneriomyces sp. JEL0708]
MIARGRGMAYAGAAAAGVRAGTIGLSAASRRTEALASHIGRSRNMSTTVGAEVRHQKMQSIRMFMLNRPKAYNALNLGMIQNMLPQLQVWQDSDLCKVIVLTAVDGPAFCAGGDVKSVVKGAMSGKAEELAQSVKFFEEEYRLNHLIGTSTKPFISVMNGITMGGGVGLSVHAPFRIATEKTLFAMPEVDIGLFPDVGGSFFLPRLDGELGTYLGLTATQLRGDEVFIAGIATHYIPSERLPSLYTRLAELETDEIEVVNGILEEFVVGPDMERFREWKLGGEVANAIDRCFKFDTIEQIVAALEKETQQKEWAQKTLDQLKTKSPTSLKVTLAQLRRGRKQDFAECFMMEYNMANEFLLTPDFLEGVDAKLVSKRGTPKWNPTWSEMDKLTPSIVNRYFLPPRVPRNAKPHPGMPSARLRLLNTLSYYDYPHHPLSSLPTTHDIKRVINGTARRGRSLSPPTSFNDVIEYFEMNWGGYDTGVIGDFRGQLMASSLSIEGGFGRGKVGMGEKVRSVLERGAEEKDGKVLWKGL